MRHSFWFVASISLCIFCSFAITAIIANVFEVRIEWIYIVLGPAFMIASYYMHRYAEKLAVLGNDSLEARYKALQAKMISSLLLGVPIAMILIMLMEHYGP